MSKEFSDVKKGSGLPDVEVAGLEGNAQTKRKKGAASEGPVFEGASINLRSKKRGEKFGEKFGQVHTLSDVPLKKKAGERRITLAILQSKRSGIVFFAAAAVILFFIMNLANIWYRGLDLRDELFDVTSSGYNNLVSGTLALAEGDFEGAEKKLSVAEDAFLRAELKLWFLQRNSDGDAAAAGAPAMNVADLQTLGGAENIIIGGKHLTQAALRFHSSAQALQSLPKKLFLANSRPDAAAIDSAASGTAEASTGQNINTQLAREELSLTDPLLQERDKIIAALQDIETARAALTKVPKSLIPYDLRGQFGVALRSLNALGDDLQKLKTSIPAVLTMLGAHLPHRYIILLQNNSEIRPSGGFIGSYMTLEIDEGRIIQRGVHDSYQTDWNLKEEIEIPRHFLPNQTRWHFRDSNYSADFPTSATAALWLLQKAGVPGVDTVIAIDQSLLRDLFAVSGPVAVNGIQRPLTAENYETILSYVIESKLAGTEDPKKILKDFVPQFQEQLLKSAQWKELAAILRKAIEEKHLMGYSQDEGVQSLFAAAGMDGALNPPPPDTPDDYLAIARSSFGGNKSDAYISEKIIHETFLMPDGSVEDEVTIARTHTWTIEEENAREKMIADFGYPEPSPEVISVLGTGTNSVAMRVYVPKGSALLEINGQEVNSPGLAAVETGHDEDIDATYFYAELQVPHTETGLLKLRYRLPWQLPLDPVNTYTFSYQTQPGHAGSTFTKNVTPPPNVKLHRFAPAEASRPTAAGVLHYEEFLTHDQAFTSVWGM